MRSHRLRGSFAWMTLVLCAGLTQGCARESGRVVAPGVVTDTGAVMALPLARQQAPAWSAKGLLAYRDEGIVCVEAHPSVVYSWTDPELAGLWVLDLGTGERQRLLTRGSSPAWSRDGTKLAYTDAWNLHVYDRKTGLDRVVATEAGRADWSVIGDRLVFEDWSTGAAVVATMRLDGSGRRTYSPGAAPRWHPWFNGAIYQGYEGPGASGRFGIKYVDFDTGSDALLYETPGEPFPAFSPTGASIAFVRDEGAGPRVWVMNAQGAGARARSVHSARRLAWSPDGRALAFENAWSSADAAADTSGIIWRLDLATGEEVPLTSAWPSNCPQRPAGGGGAPGTAPPGRARPAPGAPTATVVARP